MCRVIRLKELTPSVQTAVVIQSFKLQLPSSLSNCSCHPVLQTAVVIQSCKLQLPSSPENCSCHPAFQTAVVIQSCKLPLSSIQTAGDWRIQGIHLSNCRGLENSGNLSFKLQGTGEFRESVFQTAGAGRIQRKLQRKDVIQSFKLLSFCQHSIHLSFGSSSMQIFIISNHITIITTLL